jgi:multidrug resistance efflux pump
VQLTGSAPRQQITAEQERQPVDSKPPPKGPVKRPGRFARFARSTLKIVATLLILTIAVLAALIIWDFYVASPWTRDGSVRVQVANVAPQVSGQITEIRIVDNQFVHRGDVLYVIDPFDFQVVLDTKKAQRRQRAADVQVKRVQAERRAHLTDLATTPEEQQQYAGSATQAQAAFDAAQAEVAQADINLQRTQVRSPVNGYVTNLLLRVGDYAVAGTTNISVIDADSYWIDGYFEETKMAHICIGDRAEAKLMGYHDPIIGQVQTVTRGISVANAAPSTQGLPNVNPVYTWVRRATRAGAHPDHARSRWRPPCFGYDRDSDDPRCRSPGKRRLVAAALRKPCGAIEQRCQRSAAVSRLRAADRQRERRDRNPSHASTIRTSDPGRHQPGPCPRSS